MPGVTPWAKLKRRRIQIPDLVKDPKGVKTQTPTPTEMTVSWERHHWQTKGAIFWGEREVPEADATLRVLHGIVLSVVHGRAHFQVFAQDLLPNDRAEKR